MNSNFLKEYPLYIYILLLKAEIVNLCTRINYFIVLYCILKRNDKLNAILLVISFGMWAVQ